MELFASGILVGVLFGLYVYDAWKARTPSQPIGSQSWWHDKFCDAYEPPQHCDAPWNPYRDDIGPRGRLDVTPGGRRDG